MFVMYAIFHIHKLITQWVLPYKIGDPLDVSFPVVELFLLGLWFPFDDELHLHMFLGAASLCLMHSFLCRQLLLVRVALLICLIMSIPQSGDLNRIIMPFGHFRKCIRCEHC
eukprot:662945_1